MSKIKIIYMEIIISLFILSGMRGRERATEAARYTGRQTGRQTYLASVYESLVEGDVLAAHGVGEAFHDDAAVLVQACSHERGVCKVSHCKVQRKRRGGGSVSWLVGWLYGRGAG